MKCAANKTIWTEFTAIAFYFESNKCHNLIIYSYQHSMKKIYLGFFKSYQPKATGGGFLVFEWTLSSFS
jgi:hypothetical protein